MKKKVGIKQRIISFVFLLTVFGTIATGLIGLSHIWIGGNREIDVFSRNLKEQNDVLLRAQVDSIYSLLENYHERFRSGELTEEEAKLRAVLRIGKIRYDGGRGYFWIHTCCPANPFNPIMIMHPTRPDFNGKPIKDFTDIYYFKKIYYAGRLLDKDDPIIKKNVHPTKLFLDMNRVAVSNGGGFVSYYWPKPIKEGGATEEGYPKKSFVRLFKPWEWVVGTGVYIDDMEKNIAERNKELYESIKKAILYMSLTIVFLLLTGIFLSMTLSRRIITPIDELSATAARLSRGDYTAKVKIDPSAPYEILQAAQAFNAMTDALNKRDNELLSKAEELSKKNKEIMNLLENISHTQKMEALGLLAGGIAHDFNNLLGGILGAATTVRLDSDLKNGMKEDIDIIISSAQRASSLTSQLLSFSRKSEIQNKVFSMNAVLSDMINILKHTFRKDIRIEYPAPQMNYCILGDPGQLQQALMNIAVNARDAMPEGGILSIKMDTAILKKDFWPDITEGSYVRISIFDTGTGISEKTIQHIYEPFFTTKDKGKGTGLGLSISHQIIKKHNGFITVQSELGKGTAFMVYLPFNSMTINCPEQKEKKLVKGSGKIICIDDEECLRKVLQHMFTELGYETLVYEDPYELIEYYRAEYKAVSLVVIDSMMPKMSGDALFQKLKEINPDIQVILISGMDISRHMQDFVKNGLLRTIKKPFDIYEISEVVAEVILTQRRPQERQ